MRETLPLEPSPLNAYHRHMSDIGQPVSALRESLARSRAQIVSGDTVSLMPVLGRLRGAAEKLEAEQGVTADGERVVISR